MAWAKTLPTPECHTRYHTVTTNGVLVKPPIAKINWDDCTNGSRQPELTHAKLGYSPYGLDR